MDRRVGGKKSGREGTEEEDDVVSVMASRMKRRGERGEGRAKRGEGRAEETAVVQLGSNAEEGGEYLKVLGSEKFSFILNSSELGRVGYILLAVLLADCGCAGSPPPSFEVDRVRRPGSAVHAAQTLAILSTDSVTKTRQQVDRLWEEEPLVASKLVDDEP